jgi:cytochrome c biogenesis protein CcmG/thiol:disulfide interchange protein DsbE
MSAPGIALASKPVSGRPPVAVLAGAVVLLVILGVALARGGTGRVDSPLIGKPAPDFQLASLEGQTVSMADYAGRPLIVSFWASWCQPCDREVPLLARAADTYSGRDLGVVGILFSDDPAPAREFLVSHGARYPALADPAATTAVRYGVFGIPETFFVGRDGRIVSFRIGEISWTDLTAAIEAIE